MMTAIRQLLAATRISVFKSAKLAPKMMTAMTARTAQRAMPARTLLEALRSPHLGVSSALQAKRIMTQTPPRLARPAHRVDTQRKAALATASDVLWVDSQQPLEGPVKLRASHANRVSSLLPHHRHVTFAHLVELMVTPIQPPSVWTAKQGHTLAVVRPHATSARLVRLTAMQVQPHLAQHAWVASTGRLRQLIS